MAVLKVHGHPMSGPTMRVLACLYEKDLEFEFVPVDMKSGAHKKESFLAMNPFGQIPVFEDGDLVLFESRAITQHIAHAYPTSGTDLVFHGDHRKMSTLAVWMEVESQKFDQAATKLAFEFVFKKRYLGLDHPDEAVVKEYEEKLAKVLDVYEERLGRNGFLSGDGFGLADLHHTPMIHFLMSSPAKTLFGERPRVAEWVAQLLARPSWLKVLALPLPE